MLHYHIIIHGDVQGVGFRYYTQKNAFACGVNGWVRNNIDGSVEIDTEGKEANMAAFLGALKNGNKFSHIESTDIQNVDEISEYSTFEIADDEW